MQTPLTKLELKVMPQILIWKNEFFYLCAIMMGEENVKNSTLCCQLCDGLETAKRLQIGKT